MASFAGTVTLKAYSASRDSSRPTVFYDPKTFITHAASHCHPFGHCKRSSTAASRRSLGSVSVPVWLTILSDQLPVIALVGRNPANKLMGREPLPERRIFGWPPMRAEILIRY